MARPDNQQAVRNRILRAVEPADFERLAPHLKAETVEFRNVLVERNRPIERIYFPETAVISIVADFDADIEVGLIGREGVVGYPALLDVGTIPFRKTVQVSGMTYVAPVEAVLDLVPSSPDLNRLFNRYAYAFTIQNASTLYANAHLTVAQRLARWLLMLQDRSEGDVLSFTHDWLATLLCVRRPGVTVALHVLEGYLWIRSERGKIIIRDRAGLIDYAGDGYGFAEAEYDRVIGAERSV